LAPDEHAEKRVHRRLNNMIVELHDPIVPDWLRRCPAPARSGRQTSLNALSLPDLTSQSSRRQPVFHPGYFRDQTMNSLDMLSFAIARGVSTTGPCSMTRLRIEQAMHVHDEVAHVSVVDGLLRLRLPGRIGGRIVRIDADDIELVEILELDVLQLL